MLVRKWEDSNACVRRVVISCVSACLCTVWCVVCGLCCVCVRAQGARARAHTHAGLCARAHGDDGGPCLLPPCRANLSLARSLGSNPLYKSLVTLRSYCWMGIEKPLSLPNGLVPVGTDMGCIPGFAE